MVGRTGHALSQRSDISIQDLQAQIWILQARGSTLRRRVDALFKDANLGPPQHIVNTDSFLMTLASMTRTDAVTIISEPVAPQQAASLQIAIIPTAFDPTLSSCGLILPKQRPLPPAVATVVAALNRHLDEQLSA